MPKPLLKKSHGLGRFCQWLFTWLFVSLITLTSYAQSLSELSGYLDTCETAECLDTLQRIDLQGFINEVEFGERVFRKALAKARKLDHPHILPTLYEGLSIFFYYQGAFDSSFYYKIEAIKKYEERQEPVLAGRAYTDLGYTYKRINLEKGFEYMRSGIKVLEDIGDREGLKDAYNNFGVLHEMNDKPDSALYYYEESLRLKEIMNDSIGIPYSLENIALIHILNKEYVRAEANLNKALVYRRVLSDQQGLLGNYINLAELHYHKGSYDQSIFFFNQALNKEKELSQPYAAQYCYEKMTTVYRAIGQFERALEAHVNFTNIKDSLSNEQNIKNVEQLTIQYESEKKEKEIELLSIENQLKVAAIENANNRFYASLGGLVLTLLTLFLFFNRYQHKQRALLAEERTINQKLGFKSLIEGEEKERKRIAQELHDGLGQLLSTARLNVSAMEDQVEKHVLKQWKNAIKLIDDAVTEVRHISHNMMPNALISIGFEAAIKEQVHIINDTGKIKVHTEMPTEKIDLSESEAISLYRVIQEVLNNALKYSNADNIWLSITTNGFLKITIKDDGKGFDENIINSSRGIGWRNIESRMAILNGEVNIVSTLGIGSEISLKLAV